MRDMPMWEQAATLETIASLLKQILAELKEIRKDVDHLTAAQS